MNSYVFSIYSNEYKVFHNPTKTQKIKDIVFQIAGSNNFWVLKFFIATDRKLMVTCKKSRSHNGIELRCEPTEVVIELESALLDKEGLDCTVLYILER